MEYGWSKENLIQDTEELKKMINNETDFKNTLFLRKMYDSLTYYIYSTYDSNYEVNISTKDYYRSLLCEACGNVKSLGRYYALVEKFYTSLFFLADEKNNSEKQLQKVDSIYLTNDETLSLVNEFFMNIPDDEIRRVFKYIYDRRYSSFRFDSTKEYQSSNDDAYTVFVAGLNKNYFSICDFHDSRKFINTLHETGHAITNLMNPDLSLRSDIDFFDEVQSLFFEIVALKSFQSEKIKNKEFPILLFSTLKSYFDIAKRLTLQECIVKVAESNDYKYNGKLFNILEKNYDIDKDLAKNVLKFKFDDEASYPLSFAVALKMANIYLDNPKEGIDLLKRTINNPLTKDDATFMFDLFDPFEGLKEDGEAITLKYKNTIKK